jgi:hypothetical protein
LGVVEGVDEGVMGCVGVGGQVDGDLEIEAAKRSEAVRTGEVCSEANGL